MERNIITIDQEKCTGCGLCIPNCPEGAIQIIDRKARLVSDLMCDGLGACLGHCPEGAITIGKREAGAYDEGRVKATIVKQGTATIAAHALPTPQGPDALAYQGCPGARTMTLRKQETAPDDSRGARSSRLAHWPVQMHLVSPRSPHFYKADFVLAADCTAFAMGDFHDSFLNGKTLGIACPKFDDGRERYVEKIRALIDEARIAMLTVVVMQAPCCRELLLLARDAAARAGRTVPIECVTVGMTGEISGRERMETANADA